MKLQAVFFRLSIGDEFRYSQCVGSSRTRFGTFLTILLVIGCRSGSSVVERTASGLDSATASSTASAGTTPYSHSATTNDVTTGSSSAPGEAVTRERLPRLEPVLKKPFPDGATDEQVCAAIANTREKDPWGRFGHLVPLYVPGSLLIVDAPASEQSKVEAFISDYHGGSWYPSVKACSQGGILVYVRGLKGYEPMDDREPGLPHLARQITQALGAPVTEYFGYFNDQDRLSDYCRADAELCEELVKLDYRNEGEGLCARALARARIPLAERTKLLGPCRQVPRAELACTEYAFDGDEANRCSAQVAAALRRH